MMLFDPRWVPASKGGIMLQGGGPEEKQTGVYSDKVAGEKG
jgi:hypothetical protein